jgi:microcystin-dependent protein
VENNVLNVTQLPSHSHSATSTATSTLSANGSAAGSTSPAGTALAATTSVPIYSRGGAPDTAMAANSVTTTVTTTIGNTGGGQAVNNMQPFLGMYYCIATQGLFQSRP